MIDGIDRLCWADDLAGYGACNHEPDPSSKLGLCPAHQSELPRDPQETTRSQHRVL